MLSVLRQFGIGSLVLAALALILAVIGGVAWLCQYYPVIGVTIILVVLAWLIGFIIEGIKEGPRHDPW